MGRPTPHATLQARGKVRIQTYLDGVAALAYQRLLDGGSLCVDILTAAVLLLAEREGISLNELENELVDKRQSA